MTEKYDGGSAFPLSRVTADTHRHQDGMTLRDYFAAAALTGLCAHSQAYPPVTEQAYNLADSMLRVRNK
jgi:hypothetical protein